MKTNFKVMIIVIVLASIPFGAYQYFMYECETLPVFMHTPSTPTIWKCMEIWKHQSQQLDQNLLEHTRISDPLCLTTIVEPGEKCIPLRHLNEIGCSSQILEHLSEYTNILDDEFDGILMRDLIGLPDGITEEQYENCLEFLHERRTKPMDETSESMSSALSSFFSGLHGTEKLLVQKNIDYLPNTLVVTGGPAFQGDPGCGAVIDVDDVTHWFEIDSISNPQQMTLLSENPHPCKVNTTSCFCNAQIELTALTQELDYFTPLEEEKYATILLDYIKNNAAMKNIEPKFRIGKLNLIFTNPDAIGFCGERPEDSRNRFFEGAIVDGYVKDYSLEKELPLLCALNDDAKWWERK